MIQQDDRLTAYLKKKGYTFAEWERMARYLTEEEARQLYEAIESKSATLESKGWKEWLTILFPFAFDEDFSEDHIKFWDLQWSVIHRIKAQKEYLAKGEEIPLEYEIEPREYVTLLILGRGLAKSSSIEAAAIMRGAILGSGYCLYVSEAQDQAEEHIGNCRILIQHEESELTNYYPEMGIEENAVVGGIKTKNATDIFICKNGWICRAKGLNSKLRGLRIGIHRPDDIKLDDIDNVNDSIEVSYKKLKQITSSIIPTQARRHATISFGQNLILETGVMNQIFTGKSDALSERLAIGITNTFEEFRENIEYISYLDENEGRIKHKILANAIPTWAGVDISQAQKFLYDSGLETFLAEYQNDFSKLKQGKVIHEYNEDRHIITWSMFEKIYGCRYIPKHWHAESGLDIGYTTNSLSAWSFVATSAMNTPLPGKKFLYRGRVFSETGIDEQAIALWTDLFPDESIGKRHFEAATDFGAYPELLRVLRLNPRLASYLHGYTQNPLELRYDLNRTTYSEIAEHLWRGQIRIMQLSHEKSGELKTFHQKYGLPVRKTQDFGASDGVTEWNHLLRGDYTLPHPFYEDELLADGTYKLGCPELFYIVDDDQRYAPRDDRGLKTHRESVQAWEYTRQKLTELGLTDAKPRKYQADANDATRMVFARSWGKATELTKEEKIERVKPQKYRYEEMLKESPYEHGLTAAQEMTYLLQDELARKKVKSKVQYFDDNYNPVDEPENIRF